MQHGRHRRIQRTHKHGADEFLRRRMVAVFLFFVGLLVLIAGRLFFVQVNSYEKYHDTALRQHERLQELQPERGTIFLSNTPEAYPLAVNREYFLAYLSPRDIPDEEREDVVRRVAAALDIPEDDVRSKAQKRLDLYEVLKHKVTRDEEERLKQERIPGLFFAPEKARFYPGDTLAAQVVGFVGSDGETYRGRYGIEAFFDKVLHGRVGQRKQKADARGGWLSIVDRTVQPQEDGTTLRLTIDYTIQQAVEKILAEDAEKYGAEKGSVIVMNPHTGAILAMAMTPTFSPNDYGAVEDIDVFRNTLVSDSYEPGSVMKTVTMAVGLDSGKITPESTYVDTGSVSIGGYTIRNAEDKVYGLQTMTYVLEESINTGVMHVMDLIGNRAFKEYAARFGFGAKTGIDLPAESSGNTRNLEHANRTIEFYTASFGQGITVTPLQLAVAYSAFANGGNLVKPHVIAEQISPDGHKETVKAQIIHRVISESASEDVTKMLEQVVVGGHARLAGVPGYRVAGKTGTAQVVDPETGTYFDDSRKNATFVGYGPLGDPQFVVLVKYDNPQNVEWAATSAAPTFGRIIQFLFDDYGILPTEVK